jgi:hypothetical protein
MDLKKGNIYIIKTLNTSDEISGILLDVGKEWILLKNIWGDFMINGYVLLRRKYITDCCAEKKGALTKYVLLAKDVLFVSELDLILDTIKSPFNYLFEQQKTFEIEITSKDMADLIYLGRIVEMKEEEVCLEMLSPNGKWENKDAFSYEEIMTIKFDTDYVNSLLLFNSVYISGTS